MNGEKLEVELQGSPLLFPGLFPCVNSFHADDDPVSWILLWSHFTGGQRVRGWRAFAQSLQLGRGRCREGQVGPCCPGTPCPMLHPGAEPAVGEKGEVRRSPPLPTKPLERVASSLRAWGRISCDRGPSPFPSLGALGKGRQPEC